MKYRMYVDEVGNSDLGSSNNPNHRYLSLTGVIMELSYVDQVVFPRLESLKKRYFGSHVDDPIILHRKELVNKRPPFERLQDEATCASFNSELLALLAELDYRVITVVIDKKAHAEQYKTWQFDPYHYCLMVLLERFVMWLESAGQTGDVLAESRGGKPDMRLKDSFERLSGSGTDYVSKERLMARLTSRQLKVKAKANNIAGLQLADLIAHPSFKCAQAKKNNEALPDNFGGEIAKILESSKYDRSPRGKIEGWGRKCLP
jgi:hypothetical protein